MGLLIWLGLRRPNHWEPPTLLDHILVSPLTFLAIQIYHLLLFLRGAPFHPPRDRPAVKVVCISDTHDQTVAIPPGDILIHAGDMTNAGTAADIQKQIDWLRKQPHAVKIVVAGNHDSWFDGRSRVDADVKSGAKVDMGGIHYLESSGVEVEVRGRKLSVFGVPDIPKLRSHDGLSTEDQIVLTTVPNSFQYTESTQPWLSKVPPETDILITHAPPKFHLDNNLGCTHLLREIWRVKPRLHIFGHVHWGAGKESIYFDEMQLAYERLMSRPRRGFVWDFFPNEAWVEIAKIVLHGGHAVLWKWLMDGPGSNQGSLMVNAAQMYGNTGKVKSRPVVVEV